MFACSVGLATLKLCRVNMRSCVKSHIDYESLRGTDVYDCIDAAFDR